MQSDSSCMCDHMRESHSLSLQWRGVEATAKRKGCLELLNQVIESRKSLRTEETYAHRQKSLTQLFHALTCFVFGTMDDGCLLQEYRRFSMQSLYRNTFYSRTFNELLKRVSAFPILWSKLEIRYFVTNWTGNILEYDKASLTAMEYQRVCPVGHRALNATLVLQSSSY